MSAPEPPWAAMRAQSEERLFGPPPTEQQAAANAKALDFAQNHRSRMDSDDLHKEQAESGEL